MATSAQAANRTTAPRARYGRFVVFAALAALWYPAADQCRYYWAAFPQYRFGWLVVPLGAWLLWRRWQTRPAHGPTKPAAWLVAGLAAAALLLPALLVAEEANPDWRLLAWCLGLTSLTFSIWLAARWGGMGWARHFAFPFAFLLTAIPWPTPLEHALVQSLTSAVATITVESLNLVGVLAVREGAIITTARGALGVEDACSGIRSLQASLMLGLFLGELYRLGIGRRALLVLAGCLLAIAANIARSFSLSLLAARGGDAAALAWHDQAGFAVMTATFFGLWALCRRFGPSPSLERTEQPAPAPPWRAALALVAWLGVALAAKEAWYRSAESTPPQGWSVAWPQDREAFRWLTLAPQALQLLGADRTESATWSGPTPLRWTAYFFRWEAGSATSALLIRAHRPEWCLPAAGFALERDRGSVEVETAAGILPVRRWTFRRGEKRFEVYRVLWEDRSAGAPQAGEAWSRKARLQAVAERRRNLGQRLFQIVIEQSPDTALADREVRALLATSVKPATE